MATATNNLAGVAQPFGGFTAPVVIRTQRLIDTTDHTDAVLIGLDGPVAIDEREGLLAVLKTHANGQQDLILTGPEGEVEVPHYALQVLMSELRKAVQA